MPHGDAGEGQQRPEHDEGDGPPGGQSDTHGADPEGDQENDRPGPAGPERAQRTVQFGVAGPKRRLDLIEPATFVLTRRFHRITSTAGFAHTVHAWCSGPFHTHLMERVCGPTSA